MGWLIALGVLVLLGCLPLGVSARYDGEGPRVRLILGPVKVLLFPLKKKEKPPKKDKKADTSTPQKQTPAKPAEQTVKTPQKPAEKPASGGSVTDFLPLVDVALTFLGDFRRKLRINRLQANVILAGSDPCDLAVNYGKAWATLGNLWPRLEELFVIRKRDVRLQCDFEASQTRITAAVDMTITLGRVLSLGVRHGLRAVKELIKITNKRKGGAAL